MYQMSRKSGLEGKLFGGESSLTHIRKDIRVNEIIICEEYLRTKINARIKALEDAHVVLKSYNCRNYEIF